MTEQASSLNELIADEYRHGFVTDLEVDTVPP